MAGEDTPSTKENSPTPKDKSRGTPAKEEPEKKEIEVKDTETGTVFKVLKSSIKNPPTLRGGHRLVAESHSLAWSMAALRLGVIADAVSTTILQPNFPFIARIGATDDSFTNTDPFGFSAATYFLPMTALFGSAITSAFVGSLSDRIGRRPCMLVCVGVSVIGTIAKYLARKTFWGFCAINFVNGLFGATVPVAIAYASDVHPNRQKKDGEIGILVGCSMIGMSGGGVAAILMENTGLFSPLWVGAALNFVAFVFMYFFLLEPDKTVHFEEMLDDDEEDAPEKLHNTVVANVVVGALLDNVGSSGLYPLTLAPLAFETFFTDFLERGESPIMSDVAYKWISVLVALMVIPGAALSQPIFNMIGPAGGCVFGNVITAVGILACLYICQIEPPSSGSLAGYVTFMYLIFPLTVVSQLSTGPMLDRLAPVNRRGFVQGINITVMNVSNAVAPWLLGTMSDNVGITWTLWTTIGISIAAAVVNLPLTFTEELKVKPKKDYQQAMGLEDHELVDRALRGEYVPAQFLSDLNEARMQQGLPFLVSPVTTYEDDKPRLGEIKQHAKEDFEFFRGRLYEYLSELEKPGMAEDIAKKFTKAAPKKDIQDKNAEAMGRWFADYMRDNGYFLDGGDHITMKEMIMKAFPPFNTDGEVNENNIEQSLLRFITILNSHLHNEPPATATKALRQAVVL